MFDMKKVRDRSAYNKACEEEETVKVEAKQPIRFCQMKGYAQLWMCDEFPGPWNKQYANFLDVLKAMREADHNQEIHVTISSPGGYLVGLSDLVSEIRAFKHVVTIVTGFAASCGFMLMSIGDEIFVSPSATLLFHSASIMMEGNTGMFDDETEHLKKVWEQMVTAYGVRKLLTNDEIEAGYRSDVKLLGSELIERRCVYPYSFYLARTIPQEIKAYGVGRNIYALCNGEYYVMQPVKNENGDDDEYVDYTTLVKLTNGHMKAFEDEKNKIIMRWKKAQEKKAKVEAAKKEAEAKAASETKPSADDSEKKTETSEKKSDAGKMKPKASRKNGKNS